MYPVRSFYTKPFKSVREQVDHLVGKGLAIPDREAAEHILRSHGYYRLSGYAHYFRTDRGDGRFRDGTSLHDVVGLHEFDERLRERLLAGLAVVEVALRFHIGHRLGRASPFAHRDSNLLAPEAGRWTTGPTGTTLSSHAEWLESYDRQERRSQEAFTQHFRRRYGPRLPVWAATEVMTFGTLTRLFQMMPENDRKLVALRFGFGNGSGDGDGAAFYATLNHLRHVRNLAAHHSRVWNRVFDLGLPFDLPRDLDHLADAPKKRIYGTLAVLRYLTARVDDTSTWYADALDVATAFSRSSGIAMRSMGFPPDWQTRALWAPTYRSDANRSRVIDAVDALPSVNRPGAMAQVWTKPNDAQRKSWIRYLVKQDALISFTLGTQSYFPTFQFDAGNVVASVADCNADIFRRVRLTTVDDNEVSLRVLDWWTTSDPASFLPASPLELLTSKPDDVRAEARRWSRTEMAR